MPELPEVETVRRTLAPVLVGRVMGRVRLVRRDVVRGAATPAALLQGCVVTELRRRGKQLAIVGAAMRTVAGASRAEKAQSRRVLVVHLGMTGQVLYLAPGAAPARQDHVHCEWRLSDRDGCGAGSLVFRDPRRFGGLFPYRSIEALDEAWAELGPDAAETFRDDHPRLARLWATSRAIKAALLDQRCLAGIGNIYADEALFRARLHPLIPARRLDRAHRSRLLAAIHSILHAAIDAGGSTLRDYKNAVGESGSFQILHAVYGRGRLPCIACRSMLECFSLGQRSTTFCPHCQQGPVQIRPESAGVIHTRSRADSSSGFSRTRGGRQTGLS